MVEGKVLGRGHSGPLQTSMRAGRANHYVWASRQRKARREPWGEGGMADRLDILPRSPLGSNNNCIYPASVTRKSLAMA